MKLRRALSLALAASAALAVALSCSSSPIVGAACIPGLDACGASCVNLGSDPQHCGRCDNPCSGGQQCIAGVCLGPGVSLDFDAGNPGGVLLPDGGVLLPDGAVVDGPGGGGSGGGNCYPPYDTPQQCGRCGNACPSYAPLCAPTSEGGHACVIECPSDRTQCDGQCVDTTSDPFNCGACENICASSICRNSSCVGSAAGHVVLMCNNLEDARQESPQTVALGNAVRLAYNDPIRVLGYRRYSSERTVSGTQQALGWVDQQSIRALELTFTGSDAIVAGVRRDDFDVVVVFDQDEAGAGTLGTLGASWRTAFEGFTATGGVIIALASAAGTNEMHELIRQAGLLDPLSGVTDVTGITLYNRAPSDAVGSGLLSEFLALGQSCTFQTAPAPDVNMSFVVSDTAAAGGTPGAPVVIHRVLPND